MKIGIVGHEAAKFTPEGEREAKRVITGILLHAIEDDGDDVEVVSGECHLGGIDIWAKEIALEIGLKFTGYPPKNRTWLTGYKPRNILIAQSDIVHCIVVDRLPASYVGMRFPMCYHCGTKDHVKSGGCWTAKRCPVNTWHIIHQGEA